ncbi:hypothetical protein GH714_012098 [Hevea brasiliensis]|uniref:Uncharacterized protein n=1 Tax=Hevea brasiliensis TaxID=3981 RepID=A0A6A6MXJ4_HEVBR|nr:hypothetical protein GH714_012098 [Hevea brasiliensis]
MAAVDIEVDSQVVHHAMRSDEENYSELSFVIVDCKLPLSQGVNFFLNWRVSERVNGVLVPWETRRRLEEENSNSSLILAAKRTGRHDPLDKFKRYTGGYNISNQHYWAYGCVVLYIGQQKFHSITTHTLDYVVHQANVTAENLRNVSDYLAAARSVSVDNMLLPANVRNNIGDIETKINSSSSTLSSRTQDNSKDIQDGLDSMRLALITLAAVMLALAFLGFLFSVLGLQCLVYFLVILGWILVAGTFILCGVFLLVHNYTASPNILFLNAFVCLFVSVSVVADTCVAMDEWVLNPTAKTAMDDIIPCVDNATAQATLQQTKEVTYQLVNVVDGIIKNVSNRNFPPLVPLYYNQSGPLMPVLCNPYNSDFTERQCAAGEVDLNNATEPLLLSRFEANTGWIYIGLVMVSAAVMLSLIFWVIYARERRHRVYTKQSMSRDVEGRDKAP